jgi:hypothetical protein
MDATLKELTSLVRLLFDRRLLAVNIITILGDFFGEKFGVGIYLKPMLQNHIFAQTSINLGKNASYFAILFGEIKKS